MSPIDAKILAAEYMATTSRTARAVYDETLHALGHKPRACSRGGRVIWSDVMGSLAAALELNDVYAAQVRRRVALTVRRGPRIPTTMRAAG